MTTIEPMAMAKLTGMIQYGKSAPSRKATTSAATTNRLINERGKRNFQPKPMT